MISMRSILESFSSPYCTRAAGLKALVLTAALLLSSACAHRVTPPVPSPVNKDYTITATWNYDFTNIVPCSASVAKGCISSYSIIYSSPSGSTKVTLSTAPVTSCSGTKQLESCSFVFNSQLPVAPNGLVWTVVTNFIDVNGTNGSTSGATGNTTDVVAGEASSVVVGLQ